MKIWDIMSVKRGHGKIEGSGVGFVPIATVHDFAGAADKCPTGFLVCGQNVSRITYPELFAVIGTTWGAGNGTTTFALPPNGVVFVGKNTETEFNAIGKTGGAKTHQLTEGQMPSHRHTMNVSFRNEFGFASNGDRNEASTGDSEESSSTWETNYTGSGQAHNNLPPYAVALKIIKY